MPPNRRRRSVTGNRTETRNTMTREMAVQEFERWAFTIKRLKTRNVPMNKERPFTKEELDAMSDSDKGVALSAESMIENFMDGTFTMDAEGNITQRLAFPEQTGVNEITYRPRITAAEMDGMKGANADTGRTRALLAAMSNQPKAIIGKMDSTDVMTAGLLVPFYLTA